MRIATWNVNSIRARAERVAAWLERSDVDVLALQETKVPDEQFPVMSFAAVGYDVVHHGHSQWNGVAIVSRVGIDDVELGFPGQPTWGDPAVAEARALGATCGGVRLWSLYVPNGRTLEDPHYAYKLDWLRALRDAAATWAAEPGAQVALAGDWNIAPLDEDVWDMSLFDGATHVSPAERAAFAALDDAGFAEVTRLHVPQAYTYWDYQRLRFPRNEGMRIDFVLATRALAERVAAVGIDREERKGKGASDHVPVVVEIAGSAA
ncbi:exodeoxyribonuclease III Xth [Beutenbergia cavernae DSM 12333]|uniref:Exodeoxyribonuclease III Xth n=1 Tax=Beutenbergia cavernae (strain ATCC BAA-8 / DSM 12333 / CCUG 43141 / JCM 11478 / NBRC 16432 / NCIMB 13614 / HKI 0122) TaxID=471853 RepID=C5C3I1_BEUC1|nr:exodeoxyribonuclease III [Beutenbergia cavernae]ACQ81890.1 exodeoxyribonuclease III Xth [Beutenbergia cavernae DSM 12333]